MTIIIIREQNVDGCGVLAAVFVQCDDPVTSEQMMELHHELVRLTKELKDSGTSDVAMEAVENVLGEKAQCISYYLVEF